MLDLLISGEKGIRGRSKRRRLSAMSRRASVSVAVTGAVSPGSPHVAGGGGEERPADVGAGGSDRSPLA